jgi:hypothetical protein
VEGGKFFRTLSGIYEELELWKQPGNIFDADKSELRLIFKRGKVISEIGTNKTRKAMPPLVMKMIRQRNVNPKIMSRC